MSHARTASTPAAARRRRATSWLALAAAMAVAPLVMPAIACAQDVEEPQSAQPSEALSAAVENFYYSASIANYPAANAFGQEVLDNAGPEPEAVLEAFQTAHDARRGPMVGLDERLYRFQNIPEIADISGQIVAVINEGRQARATRLGFLQGQIERLGEGGIAYRNAIENLRNSGEYAAPVLLSNLINPQQTSLQGPIRRAFADLGLPMVAPLMAALSSDEAGIKAEAMLALGELGYPEAIPFILEQMETVGGEQVEQAGTVALGRLNYAGGSSAAIEYLTVAEQFWLNRTPIQPDDRFEGANLWKWQDGTLVATNVPAKIYDELMAMRAAGNVLALSTGNTDAQGAPQAAQDDALALWLASNYRREIELPEGATDASRPSDDPTPGYYGAQAGVPYLQAVLDRVSGERNLPAESRYDTAAVALAAIRSLQQVVGESTIDSGASPLSRAMQFPDRRVNIEAAMAIAQALPTGAVEGGEQVVPFLAEALSQTGSPTVLIVMSNGDELNAAVEALRGANYEAEGVTDGQAMSAQASALPGVDVLVIDAASNEQAAFELLTNARVQPKLRGAAKLFLTTTDVGNMQQVREDPLGSTTTERTGQGFIDAVAAAREQMGGLPLDATGATTLAGRAGELLLDIGLGSSTLSLETARQQLLGALDDERPDIRQLACRVVALLEGGEPQRALLSLGRDDSATEEVRISAFNGLAESAKRGGNELGQADVDQLLDAAATTESLEIRRAAAEAVGALALPVDQARRLIIEDTVTGNGQDAS